MNMSRVCGSALVFVSIVLHATTEQELFLQGNKAYEAQQYATAIQQYQSIKQKGFAVWYNLGCCAYQTDNFYEAVLCWERALKMAPFAQRALCKTMLQRAQQRLGIVSNHHVDTTPLLAALAEWRTRIPLLAWQFLFLCAWYGIWRYGYAYYKKRKWALVCALLLFVGISAQSLFYTYREQTQVKGFVGPQSATVYAGPHTQFHTIHSLSAYAPCTVQAEKDEWCKIRSGNISGWVLKNNLSFV
jgi:tetratricopeptide (TPR) repeat protein